ncbi:DinB family protein [Rhodococcus sp. SMB37]|uniref:DinB family protein n=1 Tax=Rhodococcus sp. SMB37 TaxID=2512213 RepID=UPI00104A9C73|nr:DinB family protein [Rhodococcus sp. SMB37]TCN51857.1 DinB family protein [Rhodococcus sp. SMB37]
MAIRADGKDWTWVVERACPDCGFDPESVDYDEIPHLVRRGAGRWPAVLSRDDAAQRPNETSWSALEYAAHLRDVCEVFRERLESMLTRDDPSFEDWDQNAAAIDGTYGDQDPATVARELVEGGGRTAGAFAGVPVELRSRSGRRGDGVRFTVGTLALYFAHEHVHHLWDVG